MNYDELLGDLLRERARQDACALINDANCHGEMIATFMEVSVSQTTVPSIRRALDHELDCISAEYKLPSKRTWKFS